MYYHLKNTRKFAFSFADPSCLCGCIFVNLHRPSIFMTFPFHGRCCFDGWCSPKSIGFRLSFLLDPDQLSTFLSPSVELELEIQVKWQLSFFSFLFNKFFKWRIIKFEWFISIYIAYYPYCYNNVLCKTTSTKDFGVQHFKELLSNTLVINSLLFFY